MIGCSGGGDSTWASYHQAVSSKRCGCASSSPAPQACPRGGQEAGNQTFGDVFAAEGRPRVATKQKYIYKTRVFFLQALRVRFRGGRNVMLDKLLAFSGSPHVGISDVSIMSRHMVIPIFSESPLFGQASTTGVAWARLQAKSNRTGKCRPPSAGFGGAPRSESARRGLDRGGPRKLGS